MFGYVSRDAAAPPLNISEHQARMLKLHFPAPCTVTSLPPLKQAVFSSRGAECFITAAAPSILWGHRGPGGAASADYK